MTLGEKFTNLSLATSDKVTLSAKQTGKNVTYTVEFCVVGDYCVCHGQSWEGALSQAFEHCRTVLGQASANATLAATALNGGNNV